MTDAASPTSPSSSDTAWAARRLGAALEGVIGSVFFSPECHAAYVELGFADSPGVGGGVALPDGVAYVASRVGSMGRVTGPVAVAAFGVFEPGYVSSACDAGWALTEPETIARARALGAAAQLERLLGPVTPEVEQLTDRLEATVPTMAIAPRALAAGVRSLGPQGDGWARFFWIGDLIREYRGDSHNIAWAAAGLDGAQISLLSDPYRGLPLRSYSASRGWSPEQLDGAFAALVARSWLDDDGLTDVGASGREAIELATDEQCAPIATALGDEIDRIIDQLNELSARVMDGGGYPRRSPLTRPA